MTDSTDHTRGPYSSWRDSLQFLRDLTTVPAAQANAVILMAARGRWSTTLVARTSMHDLLFAAPGQGYPFRSMVRVQWTDGPSAILRWHDDRLVEETSVGSDHVDSVLDGVLDRLVSPALICRSCGRPVTVSAERFEVFEQMHYTCFHYLFEHDPFDRDEESTAGGCPSANLDHPLRGRDS